MLNRPYAQSVTEEVLVLTPDGKAKPFEGMLTVVGDDNWWVFKVRNGKIADQPEPKE